MLKGKLSKLGYLIVQPSTVNVLVGTSTMADAHEVNTAVYIQTSVK